MFDTRLVYNSSSALNCFIGSTMFSKSLSASWVQGSGGGLDSGTVAANCTYHAHVIDSAGVADVLLSAAPVSPTIPSGWAATGQVLGSVITNSSAQIIPFEQKGNEFLLTDAFYDASDAAAFGDILRTVSVPIGAKVQYIALSSWKGTAASFLSASDADLGPSAGGNWAFVGYRPAGISPVAFELRVWTNASGQIYTRDANSAALITLIRKGWLDPRVNNHA